MKTGLVVEGGGMKCAYNAGILDAYLDNGISFDYCIGVSGAAGNLVSFLAGQRGRNLRFYTTYTKDPYYFGLKSLRKSGDLFNLRHIYGEISNSDGIDPVDYQAFRNNPTEYQLVVTNAVTAEAVYRSKEDIQKDDYSLVMASSALPAACRPIAVDGAYYYDGGLADPIPVRHAFEEGCERVVVILSKPRDYVRKPQKMMKAIGVLCRGYPEITEAVRLRHLTYNKVLAEVLELERQGKIFLYAPDGSIRAGTYTMDEKVEKDLYEAGIKDFYERREQLQEFLDN